MFPQATELVSWTQSHCCYVRVDLPVGTYIRTLLAALELSPSPVQYVAVDSSCGLGLSSDPEPRKSGSLVKQDIQMQKYISTIIIN